MNTDQTIKYIFYLSILLIIFAYFVGATNVFAVVGNKLLYLVFAITGRDITGKFSNYPQGAGSPPVQ